MDSVVCVIGQALEPALAREAAQAVAGAGRWLGEGRAFEVEAHGLRPDTAAARVRAALDRADVDVVGLPAGNRRKRLLVSDMDSTIITVECIDELADHVGLKAEVAEITRRAMNGELDFVAALRARVELLAGLPAGALDEVYRERVRLMPGALTCVRTMRRLGARTALVSGGFTFFTARVAEAVGFEVHEANELEIRDGHLTGRVLEPVRGGEAKLGTLLRLAEELGVAPAEAVAVGDGANDLAMLRAAGLGVAFRAHPRVARAAPISIAHGDLIAVLYLQGVPAAEFVTA